MSTHAVRLTLAAVAVAALAALMPGTALARTTPRSAPAGLARAPHIASLTSAIAVSEPGGSKAGTTTSLGLTATFRTIGADPISSMEIDLPSGALLNTMIDKGACLTAAAPVAACELAAGAATVAGVSAPAALYLVKAPDADEVAGVQLVAGSLSKVGALSLHSPLDLGTTPTLTTHLIFTGLGGSAISSLTLGFEKVVRLPSSCSPTPSVSLWTQTSLSSMPTLATALLPVTGCSTLGYSPSILSSVSISPKTRQARLTTTITQPAGQSATSRMKVSLAPGLVPRKVLRRCLEGHTCTIGSVDMQSPVLPTGMLAHGTMQLSGTQTSPVLTITFAEPAPLVITGSLSHTNGQMTLNAMPDVPLTSMILRFSGTSSTGPVLIANLANCDESQYHATLFPSSGVQAAGLNANVFYRGCKHFPHRGIKRPTVSVSLSGLASGHPRLSVRAARGAGAPKLRSAWIRVPPGLSFDAAAIAAQSSLPAGVKRELIHNHGRLYVSFRHPLATWRFSIGGPLLTESSALVDRLHHGAVTMTVFVGFRDTIGDEPMVGRELTEH